MYRLNIVLLICLNYFLGKAEEFQQLIIVGETEFHLISDKVSWDEANAICMSNKAHLAILDTSTKAKETAKILEQIYQGFRPLWIGGQKKTEGWGWVNESIKFSQLQYQEENFNFLYPPWDNVNEVKGNSCLGFSWNENSDPLFAHLFCGSLRPFLCEPSIKTTKTVPKITKIKSLNNVDYVLYDNQLTWHAAVAFCHQRGFTLANMEDTLAVQGLSQEMTKFQPPLVNIWIGAHKQQNEWTWIENGEEVKEMGEKNGSKQKAGFPRIPEKFHKDCLALHTTLLQEPTFIPLPCDRQRSFVCMKRKQSSEPVHVYEEDGQRYSFHNQAATWEKALQTCQQNGLQESLLIIDDENELRTIMEANNNLTNPLKHVWIGGKINNQNQWVWVGQKEYELTTNQDFLSWCDHRVDPNLTCLNLDFHNSTAFIYGLECNATQSFICEMGHPIQENFEFRTSQVHFRIIRLDNSSAITATDSCNQSKEILWEPDFKRDQVVIQDLGKYLSEIKSRDIIRINGGRFNQKITKWMRISAKGRPEKFTVITGNKPHNGDCLAGRLSEAQLLEWISVDCEKSMVAYIICDVHKIKRYAPIEV